MLTSTTRIFAVFAALIIGAATFATSALADRKKRGFSVTAGKDVGKRGIYRQEVRRGRAARRYHSRRSRLNGYRRGNRNRHFTRRGNHRYATRRGYRQRKSRRGFRTLAGHDFGRVREVYITIDNNQPAQTEAYESEPIVIEKLRPIPRIIRMTEHQKHLGKLRAGRRGESDYHAKENGITVISKEPQGGLSGEWNERIEKDDFGDETIVYFQD